MKEHQNNEYVAYYRKKLNRENPHLYDICGWRKNLYYKDREVVNFIKTEGEYLGSGASKDAYNLGSGLVGSVDNYGWFTNQIPSQIEIYNAVNNTPFAELVNPILKYGSVRGTHNRDTKTSRAECYIIAPYADIDESLSYNEVIRKACALNHYDEIQTESEVKRINKLADSFEQFYTLRDLRNNSGNYGVIYDGVKRLYRAVFIDYGLDKSK